MRDRFVNKMIKPAVWTPDSGVAFIAGVSQQVINTINITWSWWKQIIIKITFANLPRGSLFRGWIVLVKTLPNSEHPLVFSVKGFFQSFLHLSSLASILVNGRFEQWLVVLSLNYKVPSELNNRPRMAVDTKLKREFHCCSGNINLVGDS